MTKCSESQYLKTGNLVALLKTIGPWSFFMDLTINILTAQPLCQVNKIPVCIMCTCTL